MITLKHKYYDDYDRKTYYEYDVWEKKFYENKDAQKLIINKFAEQFNVNEKTAEEIIDTFDLWEDKGLLEELLYNYMEELDEIFWDDEYWYWK